VAAALLWMGLSKLFVDLRIMPPPRNSAHAWQIAGLMALGMMVSWKYVISLFLSLHILNSYVYLGNSSFWQYVMLTGHRLTRPLRWAPLRIGKLDLGPILLLIAVIAGSHYASVGLAQLYRRLPL
jgi:uncharacterized protein YggT (Ycf19 family)